MTGRCRKVRSKRNGGRDDTWQKSQEGAGGSGEGEIVEGITHGRNERKGQMQEQEGRWQISHWAGMTGRAGAGAGITPGRIDRKGQVQEQVSHLAGMTGRDRCRSRYHTWQE
jgi:hypothetical protein